jgi:glutamate-1-semialdehyde 2,1-aminomutase
MLKRALATIPLGSQTFSKSITQYPKGVSPLYIKKGMGSRIWDVDGNEYIDFVNALASITLGYNDPDVNAAVREQLTDGVIFSLSHQLEIEVSEKIVSMVPCAEMVRFGKNGSDATAGAIRLARAHTGRDHVAVCGYHGWQDWYIGATTRNKGVPRSTRELTHLFTYNDIDSLNTVFRQMPDQVACVIMEPMNIINPEPGFLESVRELAHRNGAVLIFDETVTGFRYARGGAQEYFNVIPDLATFGKGMANGYPVSAVTGRSDIMQQMEEIFFSFTFGGETLSLAAALATLQKLEQQPVIEKLWSQGRKVKDGVISLIEQHHLTDQLSVAGKDCWSFLLFQDTSTYSQWEMKTLFLQEIFSRGLLAIGTHNMSYAHSDDDIHRLLIVYDEVFAILREVTEEKNMAAWLKTETLMPLFKVR